MAWDFGGYRAFAFRVQMGNLIWPCGGKIGCGLLLLRYADELHFKICVDKHDES